MSRPSSWSTLVRIFLFGCVGVFFQVAVGAALMSSTLPAVICIAANFLLGVPLGVWITRRLPGLTFPAMCLLAMTASIPAFIVDVPLWGQAANLSKSSAVPTDAAVAGYLAPGWRIDMERASDEILTLRRGHRYGTRRLAPLVGETWTEGKPVELWVAGETRDSGKMLFSNPQFWNQQGGEFVRLVGTDLSVAQHQAGRAADTFGLLTSSKPVIVMRASSVADAIAAQYAELARSIQIPMTIWTILIGITAIVIKFRSDAVNALRA
jgi:hypothetical protein